MNTKKFFKPRNNSVNDKLLNLSALFFATNIAIFSTLYTPITIFGNIVSLGLFFYTINIFLLHLFIEIYGIKLTRKLVLSGFYAILFVFILQLPPLYTILQNTPNASIFNMLKFPLLATMVHAVIYLIGTSLNVLIYRIIKNKVKDYLIVRHVATNVFITLVIVALYYMLSTILGFGITASLSTEFLSRLPVLFIQVVLLYILVNWLSSKNNYYNNNYNKGNYNNRKSFQKNLSNNNSNVKAIKGEKNEKYNANNAEGSRTTKKYGDFKKRNQK